MNNLLIDSKIDLKVITSNRDITNKYIEGASFFDKKNFKNFLISSLSEGDKVQIDGYFAFKKRINLSEGMPLHVDISLKSQEFFSKYYSIDSVISHEVLFLKDIDYLELDRRSNDWLSEIESSIFYRVGYQNNEGAIDYYNCLPEGEDINVSKVIRSSEEIGVYVVLYVRGVVPLNGREYDYVMTNNVKDIPFDIEVYSLKEVSLSSFYGLYTDALIPYHDFSPEDDVLYGVSEISYMRDGVKEDEKQEYNTYQLDRLFYNDIDCKEGELCLPLIVSGDAYTFENKEEFLLEAGSEIKPELVFFSSKGFVGYKKKRAIVVKKAQPFSFYVNQSGAKCFINENFELKVIGSDLSSLSPFIHKKIGHLFSREATFIDGSEWLSLVAFADIGNGKKILSIPVDDFYAIRDFHFSFSFGAKDMSENLDDGSMIDFIAKDRHEDLFSEKLFTVEQYWYYKGDLLFTKEMSIDTEEGNPIRIGMYPSMRKYHYHLLDGELRSVMDYDYDLSVEIHISIKDMPLFSDEYKAMFFPSMYIQGIRRS